MGDLRNHVLFRFSKQTGKIDTTMTSLGNALMQMWALNNTPKTKSCIICEQDSGKVVFQAWGTTDGFPKVKKEKDLGGVTCEDYGIPLDTLQEIGKEA